MLIAPETLHILNPDNRPACEQPIAMHPLTCSCFCPDLGCTTSEHSHAYRLLLDRINTYDISLTDPLAQSRNLVYQHALDAVDGKVIVC